MDSTNDDGEPASAETAYQRNPVIPHNSNPIMEHDDPPSQSDVSRLQSNTPSHRL
jgi:hypothetical protein